MIGGSPVIEKLVCWRGISAGTMVAIFIDESGNFTPASPLSAVGALTLPHRVLSSARRELMRVTDGWPRVDGELKGGQLSTGHVVSLVDALHKHHAILHCTVTCVGVQYEGDIEAHKQRQCELITRPLTPQHDPHFTAQIWDLRRMLERMPHQLYL
jgi:hypothetical protein